MRVISLTFVICISLIWNITARSESEIKIHAIQLAAYTSWDQMIEHRKDFTRNFHQINFPNSTYTDESIFVEETGAWLKVFLIHDGRDASSLLKSVQSKLYFKKAFNSNSIKPASLFKYPSAYRMLSHIPDIPIPSEYTAKGANVKNLKKAATPKKTESYKVQLGVFKEAKSLDYMSENYGLDQKILEAGISHDFVTVGRRIYRRYYFGHYDIEVAALAVKRQLEIKTGKKLLVVHK